MASKRIDIQISGTDKSKAATDSAAKNLSKLKTEAASDAQSISSSFSNVGSTIGQGISKGVTTANAALGSLKSNAASTASSISSSMGSLGSAVAGLASSFSLMTVAQMAWSGTVSQDFNKQFLATKVGTAAATEYVSTIQSIVAAVPGPDSWMNNLLSGAVAKQTNLSAAELKTLADMSASYYLTATGMGKSSIETQNDLNEYIKTGNTSQLERDSILKDQLGMLEGQATVSDRIKALQAAMVADGYDQVSNLNTLGNKWETVSGLIGKAATTIGNAVAPALSAILGTIVALDSATGGWSTTIGLIVASAALAAIAISAISGPLAAIAGGLGLVSAATTIWGGVTFAAGVLASIGLGPILIAVIAIAAAVAAGIYIWQNWGTISAGATAAVGNALNVLRGIGTAVFNAINWAAQTAYNYIRGGVTGRINMLTGALQAAYGLARACYPYVAAGVTGAIRIATGAISAAYNAVRNLYNYVAAGVTGIVRTVTGSGPAGPGDGPSGSNSQNGIGYNYQYYQGSNGKNPWNGDNLTGNCVDMTLGLIGRYGGSMIQGTWNGGPHVWYKSPEGKQFDPARYALQGIGRPPAAGPGDGTGDTIIIQGDIYGYDDFAAKVNQAAGTMTKDIRRMR